jgi:ubiquinone/menaquinone biosynthesis C-methylase UbiE
MSMQSSFRCIRCRRRWSPGTGANASPRCIGCGASIRVDAVAIDFMPAGAPGSPGARAMQSRALARVYQRLWRPALFGLSTALGAPSAKREAQEVLQLLGQRTGPWLDLSCGPGGLLPTLVAAAGSRTVFGLDRSRAMLERARLAAPTATLVRADAADLPFEDGAFGAIANLAALDLYPDPARVFAEVARVLAPGGRLVCSTFVRPAGSRASRFTAATGVQTPAIEEIADWAKRAGLSGFGNRLFRRYAIAWADKEGHPGQDACPG